MIHPHDAIRARLNKQIRPPFTAKPSLESLRRTEWSQRFELLMRNRLVMGALRYRLIEEKKLQNNYMLVKYIRDKCDQYENTGNLECLVDIANVAMLEFESPGHSNPHFTAGDDTSHVGTFNPVKVTQ